MFSVGDALLIGIVLWTIVWFMKRTWPEKFASEFYHVLHKQRQREEWEQDGSMKRLVETLVMQALRKRDEAMVKDRVMVVKSVKDTGKPGLRGPVQPLGQELEDALADSSVRMTDQERLLKPAMRAESNIVRPGIEDPGT